MSRRNLIILFVLAATWNGFYQALADGDFTEVTFGLAQGQFYGDLNHGRGVALYLLQNRNFAADTVSLGNGVYRTKLGIGVDLIYGESRVESDTEFPYDEGDALFVKGIFLIPTACFLTDVSYRACLGIGNGTFNTNTRSNRQDYGTWTYQFDVDFVLGEQWVVKAIAKYVGKVEQRVGGSDSSFALSLFGLGFGFRYL